MKNRGHNDGFTVIELIVAMAIASIIASAIYLFLMTNIKCFGTGTSITDAGLKAEYALEEISKKIIASDGITEALNGITSIKAIPLSGLTEVTNITFSYPSKVSSSPENITHDTTHHELKIGTRHIASNVATVKISPVTSSTLAQSDTILLSLTIENDDASITIKKQIKMRNKEAM